MSAREFELRDGSSDKFWKITLDGKSTTVVFGRRGTNGQSQTKTWASPDEARKNHDKLIAEKTKKGYVEKKAGAKSKVTGKAKTPVPDPVPAAQNEAKGQRAPVAEPVAAESAASLSLSLSLSVSRRIAFSPSDWAMATWRKWPAPKQGKPAPFDREACAAKLLRLRFKRNGEQPDWSGVEIPATMSREEAHYWFLALTTVRKGDKPADLVADLAKEKIDGRVSAKDVHDVIEGYSPSTITDEMVPVLRTLFSEGDLGELLLGRKKDKVSNLELTLVCGINWVIPSLPKASGDRVRALLRPKITPAKWPKDPYTETWSFKVAALLGMHDELRAVVESWPDDRYSKGDMDDVNAEPQLVIFGLGDPALVEKHMRRLRLRLKDPRHVTGWLAHTEWRALDLVADSVLACKNRDECEKLLAVFQDVKAPEAAGPMLRLLQSKTPKLAREWLDENVAHAIVGLTAVASGHSALADAAVAHLRELKRQGYGRQIADAAKALPAQEQKRTQAEVVDRDEAVLQPFDARSTPAWLARGVADAATLKATAPAWVTPGHLPALAVEGRRLSDQQVAAVLAALQASTLDRPHPLIGDLRKHADAASADAFAWRLAERWLSDGASSKEKWALAAVGALGGDASVLKLTPMVRAWPGESQHARAVLGLEVLRAIGSDTALMQLNGIAQKLKFQGLKTKARELMEDIARDKGLTRGELEDRVVPDFDLDQRGHRVFDFGARRFTLVLGPECKPMFRDDDAKGKLRDDLPEPGPKDDAAKAAEAIAAWKAIKKQLKDVVKLQADRLEQAMVTGRRWKTADFRTLVLRHPLMINLARLLLWGVYDGKKLRETFRINEEKVEKQAEQQECLKVDDQPCALRADAAIGLVHPLQLGEAAREAWGQRFADYAIVPPFPQLGRAVHRLEKGEEKGRSIERFDDVKLPAPTLVFGLEKLGWTRGKAMDNGAFDEHSRQFPDAAITAVVRYDGVVSMGYIRPEDELKIDGCCFVKGLRAPSGFGHGLNKPLKIVEVDPIVISETLHDLTMLSSKAKS
jgi:predicted DNA-binding WGR domain protein